MNKSPILAAEGASDLHEDMSKIGFVLCAYSPVCLLLSSLFLDIFSRISGTNDKNVADLFMKSDLHSVFILTVSLVPVLLCIILFKLLFKNKISYKSFKPFVSKKSFLLYTGLGIILIPLGSIISNLSSEIFSKMGFSPNPVLPPEGLFATISFILAHAVFAPVLEEILFRFLLLERLKRLGSLFAVISTSFMFAVMHNSFEALPYAFVSGLILGFLAIKTGSCLSSMIVHFLNNLSSVILIIISSKMDYTNSFFVLIAVASTFLVISVCSFLALNKYEEHIFTLPNDKGYVPMKRKAGILFSTFSMIIFMSFSLCISIVNLG